MKDFILNNEYDLLTANGDFGTSDSEQQDVSLILLTNRGEWKQFIKTGFGMLKRIARMTIDVLNFKKDLNEQLEQNGFFDIQIKIEANQLKDIIAKR